MSEPTIFEHLGGADALRRLADAQYRRCLSDPVLIPVFGTQARPGHVEHLAAWLGEVFGGPDSYTRELGGHAALLRHHANLAITEGQRERFVEIFLQAGSRPASRTTRDFAGAFSSTSNGAAGSRWRYRNRARTSRRTSRYPTGHGNR
jgi:hemoglobin